MADQAKLYVIPGSHACRTAMLMLERKQVPYRTVELLTGMHGMGVRLHGFAGHRKPIRSVEGKVGRMLGFMDRMGTERRGLHYRAQPGALDIPPRHACRAVRAPSLRTDRAAAAGACG